MDIGAFDQTWRSVAVPRLRSYGEALGRAVALGAMSFSQASAALALSAVRGGVTYLPDWEIWLEWLDTHLVWAIDAAGTRDEARRYFCELASAERGTRDA